MIVGKALATRTAPIATPAGILMSGTACVASAGNTDKIERISMDLEEYDLTHPEDVFWFKHDLQMNALWEKVYGPDEPDEDMNPNHWPRHSAPMKLVQS